ncbi:MAG: alpha/beta hydrolase [Syntrophales bacterium]
MSVLGHNKGVIVDLYFLITGMGKISSENDPFLRALSESLPGKSVFFRKNECGTLDRNYLLAKSQLLEAIRSHHSNRVVVVGHSEGGVHAMKLASEIEQVCLAVVVGTAICTFRDAMRYHFVSETAPWMAPVKGKLSEMLNSKPFVSPSDRPRLTERKALQQFLDIVDFHIDPQLFDCWVSYFPHDGKRLITEANRRKLLFIFPKRDSDTPVDFSIRNIRQFSRAIPVKKVHAFNHNFLTRKKTVSRVAVKQIAGEIRAQRAGGARG